jgi:ferredoxin
MAEVALDLSRCQGHGRCSLLAPSVFGADDSGLAVLLVRKVPTELESITEEAAYSCPEAAISVMREGDPE